MIKVLAERSISKHHNVKVRPQARCTLRDVEDQIKPIFHKNSDVIIMVAEWWWQNDITNSAGQEIDSLTLSVGYKQIIDKPIYIVNNSMSFIDLLFCTNQNTIPNYGVNVSIFDKCHHNIIFGKVNIRVPLPPLYIHELWNYSQGNVENIKYAISNFNWSNAFGNLSVDGKVKHLNETLLDIFQNYKKN